MTLLRVGSHLEVKAVSFLWSLEAAVAGSAALQPLTFAGLGGASPLLPPLSFVP